MSQITLLEYHAGIDLITSEKLSPEISSPVTCLGAYVLDIHKRRAGEDVYRAPRDASGDGRGRQSVSLYLQSPTSPAATAWHDGLSAPARCILANMEFVQFHPTCLYHPEAKSFLISEAVRGEGGILTAGWTARRSCRTLSPGQRTGAARRRGARHIDAELKKRGDPYVYLDIRHKGADFVKKRFPTIYQQCLTYGIDITKDLIPVVPAAHYFCGGVQTDAWGRSSIQKLWAIGEVACTGLHGANRLASNSLCWKRWLVFAHRRV